MNYRIEEKGLFSVIEKVEIHSTENDENKKSIPAFWERAYRDGTMETLLDATNDKTRIFGICYGGTSRDAHTFEYAIAVPCDENTEAPEGFRKNTISAQTFAVFPCIGAMPEAVDVGDNGLLFTPADAEDLEEKMREALNFDFSDYKARSFPTVEEEGKTYAAIYTKANMV